MILLIDSNGLAYRSRYAMGELSYDGVNTEVIYGFLSQVLGIAKKLKCSKLVFAWDSTESKRKAIFPEYRNKRIKRKMSRSNYDKRLDEVAHMQFSELRKFVLPQMGFSNVFMQFGFEADDVIASIAANESKSGEEIIIVSSDQDLYQCLNNNVKMYSPATKKMVTEQSFEKEYGIPPYKWKMVKCIAGCRTDDVPGIPYKGKMMGERTAIKYIIGKLQKNHPIVQAVNDNTQMIVDNEEIVGLPMKGTEKFKLKPDDISRSRFMRVFNRYGMTSFLTYEWWSWITAFDLIRRKIK